jgi:hypothetical protein
MSGLAQVFGAGCLGIALVTGPVGPLATPTTLHGSLLTRLDRLVPTREVAQIGVAVG